MLTGPAVMTRSPAGKAFSPGPQLGGGAAPPGQVLLGLGSEHFHFLPIGYATLLVRVGKLALFACLPTRLRFYQVSGFGIAEAAVSSPR